MPHHWRDQVDAVSAICATLHTLYFNSLVSSMLSIFLHILVLFLPVKFSLVLVSFSFFPLSWQTPMFLMSAQESDKVVIHFFTVVNHLPSSPGACRSRLLRSVCAAVALGPCPVLELCWLWAWWTRATCFPCSLAGYQGPRKLHCLCKPPGHVNLQTSAYPIMPQFWENEREEL